MNENKFRRALGKAWSNYSFIFIFAAIFICFYLCSESITWNGITNILRHSSVVGCIALGMSLVIITGQIDLSVGSMLSFVGGLTIFVSNAVDSAALTLLAAIGFGLLCGLLNGFLHAKCKMPAFIVTLATMLIFRSLTRYICAVFSPGMGGSNSLYKMVNTTLNYNALYDFGNGKVLTIPITGIVLVLITAVIVYLTTSTKFGKQLYAVGSNLNGAHLAGVNVDRVRIFAFGINGMLVGLAAFLWICMNRSIDPATTGGSYEMYAIAAVVLGGISMAGGKGRVIGVLFGVMSYTIIDKIIVALKMDTKLNDAVKGAILIAAILVQTMGPIIRAKVAASKRRHELKQLASDSFNRKGNRPL